MKWLLMFITVMIMSSSNVWSIDFDDEYVAPLSDKEINQIMKAGKANKQKTKIVYKYVPVKQEPKVVYKTVHVKPKVQEKIPVYEVVETKSIETRPVQVTTKSNCTEIDGELYCKHKEDFFYKHRKEAKSITNGIAYVSGKVLDGLRWVFHKGADTLDSYHK